MYKIISFYDEELGRDQFLVVNNLNGKSEAAFDTYDEAHTYVCSAQ
jgi:hypothetical protein